MEQIFVVEGTHDESLLKLIFPQIKTISVGGSQIKKDVIDFLVSNQDVLDIVLILDPDHTGEWIRKKLSKKLKNPKHIFFDQQDAFSKNRKKIGIEHIDTAIIKKHIDEIIEQKSTQTNITLSFLHDCGLTGKKHSKILRKKVADYYHIGYGNTKIFLERLGWLGIQKKDIERILDGTSS